MSRTEAAPFSSEPHTSDLPEKRDPAFKSKNPFAAPGSGNGNSNGRALIEAMVNSKIYQDYEKAFSEATGMPVALRPVESWQLPHHGKRNENPFCLMMSQKSRACSAWRTSPRSCRAAAAGSPCRTGRSIRCIISGAHWFACSASRS